jgi:hypothetical protein
MIRRNRAKRALAERGILPYAVDGKPVDRAMHHTAATTQEAL